MNNYSDGILYMVSILNYSGICFEVKRLYDGWQLIFPGYGGDVACHSGTIGATKGYVESYGFPWDNGDVSALKPKKMLKNILKLYGEF